MKTIAIIGNEVYIDSQIVQLLLKAEFYVKVAVKNITDKNQYAHLMDLEFNQNLHVSEINQEEKSAIDNFAKGCDYVLFCNQSEISK